MMPIPIESGGQREETPPDPNPPDPLCCQYGLHGLAAGRCQNPPAFVVEGASICNDCVTDLNARRGVSLLRPLEKAHG